MDMDSPEDEHVLSPDHSFSQANPRKRHRTESQSESEFSNTASWLRGIVIPETPVTGRTGRDLDDDDYEKREVEGKRKRRRVVESMDEDIVVVTTPRVVPDDSPKQQDNEEEEEIMEDELEEEENEEKEEEEEEEEEDGNIVPPTPVETIYWSRWLSKKQRNRARPLPDWDEWDVEEENDEPPKPLAISNSPQPLSDQEDDFGLPPSSNRNRNDDDDDFDVDELLKKLEVRPRQLRATSVFGDEEFLDNYNNMRGRRRRRRVVGEGDQGGDDDDVREKDMSRFIARIIRPRKKKASKKSGGGGRNSTATKGKKKTKTGEKRQPKGKDNSNSNSNSRSNNRRQSKKSRVSANPPTSITPAPPPPPRSDIWGFKNLPPTQEIAMRDLTNLKASTTPDVILVDEVISQSQSRFSSKSLTPKPLGPSNNNIVVANREDSVISATSRGGGGPSSFRRPTTNPTPLFRQPSVQPESPSSSTTSTIGFQNRYPSQSLPGASTSNSNELRIPSPSPTPISSSSSSSRIVRIPLPPPPPSTASTAPPPLPAAAAAPITTRRNRPSAMDLFDSPDPNAASEPLVKNEDTPPPDLWNQGWSSNNWKSRTTSPLVNNNWTSQQQQEDDDEKPSLHTEDEVLPQQKPSSWARNPKNRGNSSHPNHSHMRFNNNRPIIDTTHPRSIASTKLVIWPLPINPKATKEDLFKFSSESCRGPLAMNAIVPKEWPWDRGYLIYYDDETVERAGEILRDNMLVVKKNGAGDGERIQTAVIPIGKEMGGVLPKAPQKQEQQPQENPGRGGRGGNRGRGGGRGNSQR